MCMYERACVHVCMYTKLNQKVSANNTYLYYA